MFKMALANCSDVGDAVIAKFLIGRRSICHDTTVATVTLRWRTSLRCNPRRAHHIKYTRSEAEQEKYSEPPRRNPEPAVDEPTEAGSDYHACNKFTRESETSRVAGCSRRPIRTRTIGGLVRTFVACKLFAEPLESRGESGLIGLPVATGRRSRVRRGSWLSTLADQRSGHVRT